MKDYSKNNLINKWLAAAGVLLIALTVSLAPAAANDKQKKNEVRQEKPPATMTKPPVIKPMPSKVMLKCEQSSSDVSAVVKVTNNTGQTIPKGTKIYAKNQKGLNGFAAVTDGNGMQPSEWLNFTLGGTWTDTSPCTAHYFKN